MFSPKTPSTRCLRLCSCVKPASGFKVIGAAVSSSYSVVTHGVFVGIGTWYVFGVGVDRWLSLSFLGHSGKSANNKRSGIKTPIPVAALAPLWR